MLQSNPLELLFSRTMRNLFSAETQLLRIPPSLVRSTSENGLREAIEEIMVTTESHLARLEMIARRHDLSLSEKGACGMLGIVEEAVDVLINFDPGQITDLALTNLLHKASHFLKATSGSAWQQAREMGWPQVVALLETCLEEVDDTITRLDLLTEALTRKDRGSGGKSRHRYGDRHERLHAAGGRWS